MAWVNVLYHPYTHAKARGRSPTYTLTYNTLNMTIWRKVRPKRQSTPSYLNATTARPENASAAGARVAAQPNGSGGHIPAAAALSRLDDHRMLTSIEVSSP